MKKSYPKTNQSAKLVVIWGACLTTLFFWTGCNDPFNAPKSWILSIAAFWLIGWISFQIKSLWKQNPLKWTTVVAVAFLAALAVAYFFTDNKYIGFFGEYQRRTGLLSYLSLIIFFLASSFIFRLKNIALVERASIFTGFLLATYGLLQHFHHDFVAWKNPYNPIIATLGNPDFAAAIMSIFLIINFGITVQTKQSRLVRIFTGINAIYLFMIIALSHVRQGLLTSILGVIIILLVLIYQRKKIISYVLFVLLIFVSLFVTLGMLNKGPLSAYFYKMSVTYRGDYWRAGMHMFTQNPIFGVGLDRYGANFRQYRDATESLRRGPGMISNAAHNVPLHLAATGGVFVLVTFLIMTSFIFFRGIVALRKYQGTEQVAVATFLAAWLAYEAQSIISIDNLGIAIWGYVLGGILIGLSLVDLQGETLIKNNVLSQPLISISLAAGMFILSVLGLRAESAEHNLLSLPKLQSQSQIQMYQAVAKKPLTYGFREPTFTLNYARTLTSTGDLVKAKSQLTNLIKSDTKNYDAFSLLAEINEYEKNWKDAVSVRKIMYKLDPYNQLNLLQLGEDEKYVGDLAAAKALIAVINSFAANTQEAKQALIDFGK